MPIIDAGMEKTILVVFGTRPEAIKMFPVVHALQADPRCKVVTCVSAQHRGILDQVLEIAGIVPDHDLDLMRPDQTLDGLTAALLTGLGKVMDTVKPDWVVVQGDTATAMAGALAALEQAAIEQVVQRSAELHVEHIATGGDPFELGSARPLDFGHWAAHKLEQISGFAITHGEAVAIGMAVDITYSVKKGLMRPVEAERALSLIERIGFEIFSPFLLEQGKSGEPVILEGLEEFREHLGGELTVTLVPEIGAKLEVHEMDRDLIMEALEELKERSARRCGLELGFQAK